MLIKIGDFAKSTGVTIKALRHYEKQRLIEPAWVNRFNGYRYYAPEQRKTIIRLLALKNLGFSLKEIAKLLAPNLENKILKVMLEDQIRKLESQIHRDRDRVEKLTAYLAEVEAGSRHAEFEKLIAIQKPSDLQIQQESNMEIQIKKLDALTVVGLRYQGNNKNNEIAEVWTGFNKRQHEIDHTTNDGAFGICSIPAGLPEGEFEYICALPVSEVDEIPEGMITRSYPAMSVAVFEQRGSYENLRKTYSSIYQKWLPEANLHPLINGFDFEVYDKEFKNFAPDSVMYIYVPVKTE